MCNLKTDTLDWGVHPYRPVISVIYTHLKLDMWSYGVTTTTNVAVALQPATSWDRTEIIKLQAPYHSDVHSLALWQDVHSSSYASSFYGM